VTAGLLAQCFVVQTEVCQQELESLAGHCGAKQRAEIPSPQLLKNFYINFYSFGRCLDIILGVKMLLYFLFVYLDILKKIATGYSAVVFKKLKC
jgi:hypothetical protein